MASSIKKVQGCEDNEEQGLWHPTEEVLNR